MLKLGIEWGDSRVDFIFQRDERTRRVLLFTNLLHLKTLKTLYIKNCLSYTIKKWNYKKKKLH